MSGALVAAGPGPVDETGRSPHIPLPIHAATASGFLGYSNDLFCILDLMETPGQERRPHSIRSTHLHPIGGDTLRFLRGPRNENSSTPAEKTPQEQANQSPQCV